MKCGSCFRCVEDWKDAKAKGLKPQCSMPLYSMKPRCGVKVKCANVSMKSKITPDTKACKDWEPRALWNAKLRMEGIRSKARRFFDVCVRVPIGRLRKPVKLIWADDYDGRTDCIIHNAVPECPHCGEMAYSTKRCVFCGQRFIQDELTAEWSKPPETVKLNCPMCGGEKTLVGARSRINGHFHGKCEKCGCELME